MGNKTLTNGENVGKRERNSINKPTAFIEYLRLLNLLPNDVDDFLRAFSKKSDRCRRNERALKKIRLINQERQKSQLEIKRPENLDFYLNPNPSEIKKLFGDFMKKLPDELKQYLEKQTSWKNAERELNMMVVERDSIDLLIAQRKLDKEFEKDFSSWKKGKSENIVDSELYETFQREMIYSPETMKKYNAEKYRTENFIISVIDRLPQLNRQLMDFRFSSEEERLGFKGFLSCFMVFEGKLEIWAQGLMRILIEQKLSGHSPIEVDRIKHCEFCGNFLYAYKNNKRFCSEQCYAADYAQRKRNNLCEVLEKKLKKAIVRLGFLERRLKITDAVTNDQKRVIKDLEIQIKKEKKKNGTL